MNRSPLVGVLVATGSLLAGYALFLRRWQLEWGATNEESGGPLPGDELIASPDLTATRAITVRASVDRVWPWVAQLGQGRGGLYSYDFLENLVGCDIHSADRIVPEWQGVAVGDEVRLAPEVGLEVGLVEPRHALVLHGAVSTGESRTPQPYDFTWAYVLRDGPDNATRLIVRERYAYTRRWAPLLVEPIELVSFVMTQKMLRGIRVRAERALH